MTLGYYCTCNRAWGSVTPAPGCPIHTAGGWTYSGGLRCRGRHCAHTADCYRSTWTATWNG